MGKLRHEVHGDLPVCLLLLGMPWTGGMLYLMMD